MIYPALISSALLAYHQVNAQTTVIDMLTVQGTTLFTGDCILSQGSERACKCYLNYIDLGLGVSCDS
jgi:hypothetical protein